VTVILVEEREYDFVLNGGSAKMFTVHTAGNDFSAILKYISN
jgi:hypothetical protein